VVEMPLIQNDEHEEVIPSNVKGGAPHPPRGHVEHDGHTVHEDQENPKVTDESVNFENCVAVQTRAMKERELKPPKPLKVSSIDCLEIGPEQLIEQQRSDETLKRYWKLVDKPSVEGKRQFVVKKKILFRKLKTRSGVDYKMQLVVPVGLREK